MKRTSRQFMLTICQVNPRRAGDDDEPGAARPWDRLAILAWALGDPYRASEANFRGRRIRGVAIGRWGGLGERSPPSPGMI